VWIGISAITSDDTHQCLIPWAATLQGLHSRARGGWEQPDVSGGGRCLDGFFRPNPAGCVRCHVCQPVRFLAEGWRVETCEGRSDHWVARAKALRCHLGTGHTALPRVRPRLPAAGEHLTCVLRRQHLLGVVAFRQNS
jgi:hypothetical protein